MLGHSSNHGTLQLPDDDDTFTWSIHLKTSSSRKSFDLWCSTCCVQVTCARYLRFIGQCAKTGCLPALHPALLWTAPHLWLQLLFSAMSSSHPPPCGRNWTSSSSAFLFALWFSFPGHGFLLYSFVKKSLASRSTMLFMIRNVWFISDSKHHLLYKRLASSRLSVGHRSTCP